MSSLKRPGHNLERAQTTLGGTYAQIFIKGKETFKLAGSKEAGHFFIKFRPFRGKTIRPTFFELVRHIAARNKHAAAAKLLSGFGYDLAHNTMALGRESRKAHPHHAHLFKIKRLLNKMQGDKRGVIDLFHIARRTRYRDGILL